IADRAEHKIPPLNPNGSSRLHAEYPARTSGACESAFRDAVPETWRWRASARESNFHSRPEKVLLAAILRVHLGPSLLHREGLSAALRSLLAMCPRPSNGPAALLAQKGVVPNHLPVFEWRG